MTLASPPKIFRAVVTEKVLNQLQDDAETALPEDVTHRFKRVLRLKSGANIEILDGSGRLLSGQLTYREDAAFLENVALSAQTADAPPLYLAQALIRPNKLEPLIQKATEMGVTRIILWAAERSESRWNPGSIAKKRTRLEKIALEATRQCERTTAPVIEGPYDRSTFQQILAEIPHRWFVGHPTAHDWVSNVLQELTGDARNPLGVIVGPEGGISGSELKDFNTLGIQEIRLSPHTLRTETAAFPFLCAVQWLRGRL